jgi:hypothetical protein
MKLEPKPSPRHPELMIYRNGRIYDTNLGKHINMAQAHGIPSIRGPVAYWTTVGKTYHLDVLKMVYETYVSTEMMTNGWAFDFRNGTEVKPENIKKTRRHDKNSAIIKPMVTHESWMNGNDDIYMW